MNSKSSSNENIYEKEQRIDRNFTSLLDRYNKSKTLIDNLMTNVYSGEHQKSFLEPPIPKQKRSRKFEDQENRDYNRRDALSKTIQDIKHEENQKSMYKNDSQKLQDRLILEKENNKYKNLYQQNNKRHLMHEFRLKQYEMSIRLQQESEKRQEYQDKLEQVQRQLEKKRDSLSITDSKMNKIKMKWEDEKNQIIKDYESQLKEKDEKIMKFKQTLSTFDIEQKQLIVQIENLKREIYNNQNEKQKLDTKSVEIKCLNQEIKDQENQKLIYQKECQKLQDLLIQEKDNNKQAENKMKESRLKEQELLIRYQQESEKRQECQLKLDQVKNQFEEKRDILSITDAKINKIKIKHDDEKNQIIKDYSSQLEHKKEKIIKLKQNLATLDNSYRQQIIQIENMHREIQNSQNENNQFDQVMEEFQQKLEIKNLEIKNLGFEDQAKNEQIQIQELKISELKMVITELEHNRNDYLKMYNEKLKLLESKDELIENYKQEIEQLNMAAGSNKHDYNEEMDRIESQIEEMIFQINSTKQENIQLRTQDITIKRQLQMQCDQQEALSSKYQKLKQRYETQNAAQKKQEEKLKQNEQERNSMSREIMRQTRESSVTLEKKDHKLKVLDEISGMINQFKQR